MFRPASFGGRIYAVTKAFCILIVWSCYAVRCEASAASRSTSVDPCWL